MVKTCSAENCGRDVHVRGVCKKHYARLVKANDFVRHHTVSKRVCSVDGCNEKHLGLSYCTRHYRLFKQYGVDGLSRKALGRRTPGGPRYKRTSEGYIDTWDPSHPNASADGRIALHRYVMSNHLGRALTEDENVHHISGERDDNRLENLELWSTSQPSGQRVVDKLVWAREIIALYGDQF